MLKFEHFIAQIPFDFIRLRLDTEFMGNFDFFWGIKRGVEQEFYAGNGLIECKKWFFGFGKRTIFGVLEDPKEAPLLPNGFQYPIAFDPQMLQEFNELIHDLNSMPLGTKISFDKGKKHKAYKIAHSHLS